MLNVNFIEEGKNECWCGSCGEKVLIGEDRFDIKIEKYKILLCVDCGNDLIIKMINEFSEPK